MYTNSTFISMKVGQSGFARKQLLNTLSNEGVNLSRSLLNASVSTQASGSLFLENNCPKDLLLGGISGRARPEDILRQRHILVLLRLTSAK